MAAGPMTGQPPKTPSGLSIAAQILLGVQAFVAVGAIVGNSMRLATLNSSGTTNTSANVVIVFSDVLYIPSFIAAVVVFIIWCHRVRTNTDVIAPQIRRAYSRGWAIGGWFVPIGWFWIPRYVVGDVWTASQPLGSAPQRSSTRSALLNSWWLCWCGLWVFSITSEIVNAFSVSNAGGSSSDESTSALAAVTVLSLISCVLRLAAALLALFVVRKINTLQQIRILQGPGEGHPYAAPLAGYPQIQGYPQMQGYPQVQGYPQAPGYPQPPYFQQPQPQPYAPAQAPQALGYQTPQPYQPYQPTASSTSAAPQPADAAPPIAAPVTAPAPVEPPAPVQPPAPVDAPAPEAAPEPPTAPAVDLGKAAY